MKIDFDEAADAADVADESNDQQTIDAGNELLVAANDNSLRWPLIPFPDDWSASC